ncbi:MAG: hypothetical protein GY851_17895, partial [bacterium]|nr:hypothetical protein [bacterium]
MPTASQHTQSGPLPAGDAITRRLILAYTVATALYLGTMAVLAKLGVEAIGGHTFPFYARYLPCYGSYIIPAGAMVAAGAALFASRGGSRNRPLLAMVVTWGVIIAAVALALLAQQGA